MSMDRVIRLELYANRKKILLANDLIPAAILLFTGLTSLEGGTQIPLALINIISGGLLVSFGLREWRSLGRPVHHKIQWYDVVSGLVMMLDAGMMYKPGRGFQPAHLYFIASLILMLKGLSIIKSPSLFRRLTISDAGFRLKTGLFFWLHYRWEDILGLAMDDNVLHVTTLEGDRRISLKKIANRDEVYSALTSSLPKNLQQTGSVSQGLNV